VDNTNGVRLDTIGGGALMELFATELLRVLQNIADPNTDPEAKRTISVTVAMKPNRDRDVADIELKCGSKLAGISTVSSRLFMGKHQGRLIAVESDPRQSNLFDQARPPLAAVANIKEGRE